MPEITPQILAYWAAAVALLGLMAYASLAGADFGGGVWDLLATGPRKRQQREAIAHAMGPVWEANHVWLIFVLVVLFTCFPRGYSVLMNVLFLPLHLVLAGIMLRGAAFVFRHYGPSATTERSAEGAARAEAHHNVWGAVFGAASVVSPLLLGMSFGLVTTGQVQIAPNGRASIGSSWMGAYPIGCALLALSTCAYLASVYLVVETEGELQQDFRRRAIVSGTLTAAIAVGVLWAAEADAPWLSGELRSPRAFPVLLVGGIAFALSGVATIRGWTRAARVFAVAQTVLMLLGWGLAHRDYLIYPQVPLTWAMAPPSTLVFMLIAIPCGAVLLVPSMWLMFRVFKSPR